MADSDRQRGVIIEYNSGERREKQKENKVREHSRREVKIWKTGKCNKRVSHKSHEKSQEIK